MPITDTNLTRFPNGIAQFLLFAKGGAAGALTCTNVLATDKVIQVSKISIGTNGYVTAVADLTSEFSVSAANTVTNTGGTTTSNALVAVTVARTAPA